MQVLDKNSIDRINLEEPHLIILNVNDRSSGGNLATPLPDSELSVLYYVSARNPGNLLPIQTIQQVDTQSQFVTAPDGSALAYWQRDSTGSMHLYVLSLIEGFRIRVLSLPEASPRGLPVLPAWSPNGKELAVSIATAYEMDIYALELASNRWRPLTSGGGYDFHPSWSPNGRYLAYLSDVANCPGWQAVDEYTCDLLDRAPPKVGQVHLLDLETGENRRLSEIWSDSSPLWLNDSTISIAAANSILIESSRKIWLADIETGQISDFSERLTLQETEILNEVWSDDGKAIVFQSISEENRIISAKYDGEILGSSAEYLFPRYGMMASWSPDGMRLAVGGIDGLCPYGALVFTRDLRVIVQANLPPICEPEYSPDGNHLAFEGINSRLDGRLDVYLASINGYGAINITEDLRGQNRLIGWAGGS